MRENSLVLLVTSVAPRARACAPIITSNEPMGVPFLLLGLIPVGHVVLGELVETAKQGIPRIDERDQNHGAAGFLDKHLIALEAKLFGKPYSLALPILKQFGGFHFRHPDRYMRKVYIIFL